ncbi:MAG: hypothetical protein AB2A00_10865 [Myxococcota bacterium]
MDWLLQHLVPLVAGAAPAALFLAVGLRQRREGQELRALLDEVRNHEQLRARPHGVFELTYRGYAVTLVQSQSGLVPTLTWTVRATSLKTREWDRIVLQPRRVRERGVALAPLSWRAVGRDDDVTSLLALPALRAALHNLRAFDTRLVHGSIQRGALTLQVQRHPAGALAAVELMRLTGSLAAVLDGASEVDIFPHPVLDDVDARGPRSGLPVGIRH